MRQILFTAAFLLTCSIGFSQTVGIKVISTGEVGIGEANPTEKLHVDGAIRIDDTTTPCNSSNSGIIRWNGTCFEGCDGTNWIGLNNDPACGEIGGGGGPTCNDGIQNGDETGIDCGGTVCAPCPTCTDGIQNGDETGIDCGGTVCPPCGGGGCQSGCECFPNVTGVRDMPNIGWNNEFDVGGAGIAGDGELCWKIGTITNYSRQVIGLNTDPNYNDTYTSIDHAIMLLALPNLFRVRIYESGSASSGWVYSSSTSFSGSTFCVRRTGSTVDYLMDGAVIHSTTGSSGHMYYDNSYYDLPASNIYGIRPCEFNVNDIKICPNGTYTKPHDESDEAETLIKHEHQNQIDDLTEEVELLKEQIGKLLGSQDLTLYNDYSYQIDVDLANDLVRLNQNQPNPFAEATQIEVQLPETFGNASLDIYDSYGKLLKTVNLNDVQGLGKINIEAENLTSGIYNYILRIDGEVMDSKKMVKTK